MSHRKQDSEKIGKKENLTKGITREGLYGEINNYAIEERITSKVRIIILQIMNTNFET